MSRTLSKILVVCALVIVLPLMVVGTAFACYYSINATVSIEVYVDQNVDGGTARVTYGEDVGTVDNKLEVTDGHLKEVTFRASAVGYDFVGWYAGTYREYVNALESDAIDETSYVSTSQNATVEMTEYQNLVAVFEAIVYNVGYNYAPSHGTPSGATAPEGKTSFVYGEALPTIESDDPMWYFDGWYIDGDTTNTKYTHATFEQRENIVLTGNWIQAERINITYLDDEGEEIRVDNTVYQNEFHDLDDPMNYQANYSAGFVANGYTYGWQNVETKEIITSVQSTEDITVQIVRTPIVYTARVEYNSDELTLNEGVGEEMTFSVGNFDSLSAWNNSENWTTRYSFLTFSGLTYNSDDVTDLATVLTQFISENPHETAEIVLNATTTQEITRVNVSLRYVSFDGIDYVNPVYTDTGSQMSGNTTAWTDFDSNAYYSMELASQDGTLSTFYGDADRLTVVTPVSMEITSGVSGVYPEFSADFVTLNDLIDYIYENLSPEVTDGEITITIVVYFE